MTLPASTSVLIAGGGPAGLAAAVELGTRGIETVVLEPRAKGIVIPEEAGPCQYVCLRREAL
jgi:2-polyprenyl-6-methoxyphenol hydroxylase-like FAD-dependent oxidoreductase